MLKHSLFDPKISPRCAYCERGMEKNGKVLCRYAGVVLPDFSCRRFLYAPLKRKPKNPPPITQYTKEDFTL